MKYQRRSFDETSERIDRIYLIEEDAYYTIEGNSFGNYKEDPVYRSAARILSVKL